MYLMGISNFMIVISLICSVHLVATGFGGYACAGDLSAFVFKSSYHGHAFEAVRCLSLRPCTCPTPVNPGLSLQAGVRPGVHWRGLPSALGAVVFVA